MDHRKGFTLIELLVVIAIIALLLSIILPSLNKAKGAARMMICSSNQKQMILGIQTYSIDNDNDIPPSVLGQQGSSYWECNGFWTMPGRLNYHSEENPTGQARNGLAGGWIGKYLLGYNELSEVYNCPLARVDLEAPVPNSGGRTYQQAYRTGEAYFLNSSYYLLWNYGGFDHLASGNQRRFAGPGKDSKNTLVTSDCLYWNEADSPNTWSSTHPFKDGEKSRTDQWYRMFDPTETVPDVKLNAGYIDGSVRKYSSLETVRGVLEFPSYVKIYYPRAFR